MIYWRFSKINYKWFKEINYNDSYTVNRISGNFSKLKPIVAKEFITKIRMKWQISYLMDILEHKKYLLKKIKNQKAVNEMLGIENLESLGCLCKN
jgi:hypothetical protein